MKKILLIIIGLALVFATPVYGATEENTDTGLFGQVKSVFSKIRSGNVAEDEDMEGNETVERARENEAVEMRTQTREVKADGSMAEPMMIREEANIENRVRANTDSATKGNVAPTAIKGDLKEDKTISIKNETKIVKNGEAFKIVLEENASTGHLWKIEKENTNTYKFLESVYDSGDNVVTSDGVTRIKVGAPGKKIFKFEALEEGKDQIVFDLVSPAGEKVDTKVIDLKVDDDSAVGKNIFTSIKESFQKMIGGDKENIGPNEFKPAEESNVPEEIRGLINSKREEVRNKITTHKEEVNRIREESQERVQIYKEEIEENLQIMESEQRKENVKRIYNKILETKDNSLINFDKTLDRIESVLTNISTRADKAQTEGFEIGEVRVLVNDVQEKINNLREQIKNNFDIDYNVEFSDESEIKNTLEQIKNNLYSNLEELKENMRAVHIMTRSAAEKINEALINN
jgi:predicted secreted protein